MRQKQGSLLVSDTHVGGISSKPCNCRGFSRKKGNNRRSKRVLLQTWGGMHCCVYTSSTTAPTGGFAKPSQKVSQTWLAKVFAKAVCEGVCDLPHFFATGSCESRCESRCEITGQLCITPVLTQLPCCATSLTSTHHQGLCTLQCPTF